MLGGMIGLILHPMTAVVTPTTGRRNLGAGRAKGGTAGSRHPAPITGTDPASLPKNGRTSRFAGCRRAPKELDKMSFEIPGVLWRRDPKAPEMPLVFDSPHSGSEYPEDFGFCCPLDVLRTAEDTHVDELYAAAPELGATLIGAVFPRSYLDPNRAA